MRLAFIALLLLANPLAASAACGIADLGTADVAAVRDGATLLLKDGREVRLAGSSRAPRLSRFSRA